MKSNSILIWSVLFFLSFVLFSSCKSDNLEEDPIENPGDPDPGDPKPKPKTHKYGLALRTPGGRKTEFLIESDSLMTGTLSAKGNGIEQTGWRFYYPIPEKENIFSIGSKFPTVNKQVLMYTYENQNKKIKLKTDIVFDDTMELFGVSEDKSIFFGLEIPLEAFTSIFTNPVSKLYLLDSKSGQVIKKVNLSGKFKNAPSNIKNYAPWPTSLVQRGNYLFVSFYVINANFLTILNPWRTPVANEAFVAVYDYTAIETATSSEKIDPIKIIRDKRTGNIGVNGGLSGIIVADSKDLYTMSSGAKMAGFSPASVTNSGILKIPAGKTDFDTSYFLDVEALTGGKLFWMDYIGGNKVIARILTDDRGKQWEAGNGSIFNQELVIINLASKTVKKISNVPRHDSAPFGSPVFLEDEKWIYLPVNTPRGNYIYKINVASATAEKGARIEGELKGIYQLK